MSFLPLSRYRHFTVESTKLRSSEWKVVKQNISEGHCVIDNLEPGETYSFRVVSHLADRSDKSEPSMPSQPLIVPLGDVSSISSGGSGSVTGSIGSQDSFLKKRSSSSHELDACWQRDFERQYIELEELGRGRFSVVRRCQQIMSGDEVAVKFMNRRKQNREDSQKEYEIMARLDQKHPNIVATQGLFLTATSDAIVISL